MKKIVAMMLCLVLALSLAGCGTKSTEDEPSITTVGELNGSGSNIRAIRKDVCELYLEVLEDLWNVDSVLNNEISQIGIDLSAPL